MIARSLLALLILLSGSFASAETASPFDFLPQSNGAEKEFRDLMRAGNYRQALMTWGSAHEKSDFGTSPSGIATYSYLLIQNGLPYLGFNLLVHQTKPKQIKPSLVKVLEVSLKNSPLIQKGYIPLAGGWRSIVNNESATVRIKNKRDINAAFLRANRAPKDQVNYKARIWWQIATMAPQINQLDDALRALKLLSESGQSVIGQDQIALARGRVLYQKGDLQAAIKAYNEVPKSSILWTDALEERAWTHLRSDDFDSALGDSITLVSPALAALVGPESYFFVHLMALKACDYPRVFKNSENFKKHQRQRLTEIQKLANTGNNDKLLKAIGQMETKGVNLEAVGATVDSIPRAAFRDREFIKAMDLRRHVLRELKTASEVRDFTRILGESTLLSKSMGEATVKADNARQTAISRLRVLARKEVKEFRDILNKMHIVEAEVIHRLHVDENLKGKRPNLAKTEVKDKDVLVFPYTSDEVWFDELDNYKARVKDCPSIKEASL